MSAMTIFEKIWQAHRVADFPGDRAAIVIDRMSLHEVTGGYALRDMQVAGERPRLQRDQIFAVADHAISTAPGRGPHDSASPNGDQMIASLEKSCQALGYRYVRPDETAHGIVHVTAPDQGFVLPGTTLVCGDSHTCTLGAFGTLAFAVGASEVETVLRHGALIIERPKTMRVTLTGQLGPMVSSKDVALRLLAENGVRLALGHVLEFTGPVVAELSIEARMTLCNLVAEMGTRYALIAPDDTTFEALRKSVPLPRDVLETAVTHWRNLRSDRDAIYDRELALDVSNLTPQVSWGTSPMHVVDIVGRVPDPTGITDQAARSGAERALGYMKLEPGRVIASVPIDAAFIGSCTNARISDLREAAAILKGHKIAKDVRAMCTPGSMAVRAQAEAEGLDHIFLEAGFEWRKSGCSNCAGREGPIWRDLRVISSTNRNFENRQGPGTKTHIASPATVAASAVTGRITDPRIIAGAP